MRQELYRVFTIGNEAEGTCMTSADEPVVYNGETYAPTSIGRSDIEQKNELSKSTVEVRLALSSRLVPELLQHRDDMMFGMTIMRMEDGVVETLWKGRITGLNIRSSHIALPVESLFTTLKRPGLRNRMQGSCRHVLYGPRCNINHNAYNINGVITAIASNGVSLDITAAAGYPDGYFVGGMVTLVDDDGSPYGKQYHSYIVEHVGSLIRVNYLQSLTARRFAVDGSVNVRLFPGCNKSRDACKNKFNNLSNYGGFDWIPRKNPVDYAFV